MRFLCKCYDYVCSPLKSEEAASLGSQDIFDVENDETNFTIINLGVNANAHNLYADAKIEKLKKFYKKRSICSVFYYLHFSIKLTISFTVTNL